MTSGLPSAKNKKHNNNKRPPQKLGHGSLSYTTYFRKKLAPEAPHPVSLNATQTMRYTPS